MKRKLVPILILLAFLYGCAATGTVQAPAGSAAGLDAAFVLNTSNTISAEVKAVDTAMKVMNILFEQKKMSEANARKAAAAFDQWQISEKKAKAALIAYDTVPTTATKSAATDALVQLQFDTAAIAALQALATMGGN